MAELKHATIVEVAKLAGVSPATASRAFTGKVPVAPGTYENIMDAAKQLQYYPNSLVRGLRGGKTNNIGLLFSIGTEEINNQRIYKITDYLMRKNYTPYIFSSHLKINEIRRILTEYLHRRVDGVILWTGYPKLEYNKEIAELLNRFSAVAFVCSDKLDYSFDQVIRNRSSSVAEIAEHFVATGRKRPLFVGRIPVNQSKLDTFFEVFTAHGIKMGDQNFASPEFEITNPGGEPFVKAVEKKFSGKIPFDSVFCTRDEGAAAIMSYLKRKGVKIPDDVAVVGFNNYEMCSYMDPPLSSVEFHFNETARTVLEMLWRRLEKPDMPLQTTVLKTDFVHRESAG